MRYTHSKDAAIVTAADTSPTAIAAATAAATIISPLQTKTQITLIDTNILNTTFEMVT